MRSDNYGLARQGIIAHTVSSFGLHPDYHRPSDVASKLNYEKMTRIVKLLHAVSWNLANADDRPTIEPMGSRPRM